MGGGGQGGSRADCANIGRAAGRAATLDEDFAEGSEYLNAVGKSSANMTLEEGAGSVQESGNNSWGSTSTLRASALK